MPGDMPFLAPCRLILVWISLVLSWLVCFLTPAMNTAFLHSRIVSYNCMLYFQNQEEAGMWKHELKTD